MPRRLPFKLPFTIALRSCSSCRDFQGLAIWPWSGGFMLKTHGLCQGCVAVFFQGPKTTAGLIEEMCDSHRPAEAQKSEALSGIGGPRPGICRGRERERHESGDEREMREQAVVEWTHLRMPPLGRCRFPGAD